MINDERAALLYGFMAIRAQAQLARTAEERANWERMFNDLLTGYDELDQARGAGDASETRRREQNLELVLREVWPLNPHVIDPERWLAWMEPGEGVDQFQERLVARTLDLVERAKAAPKPAPITDPPRLAQLEKLVAAMYGQDRAGLVDTVDPVAKARQGLSDPAATQESEPGAGSEAADPPARAAKRPPPGKGKRL